MVNAYSGPDCDTFKKKSLNLSSTSVLGLNIFSVSVLKTSSSVEYEKYKY